MQIVISNIIRHLFFSDFLLGILTRILYFPITYLCLASHATRLLHKMISLFMHVHERQVILFYFLSLSKLHQRKKWLALFITSKALHVRKVFSLQITHGLKNKPQLFHWHKISLCDHNMHNDTKRL